MTLACDELGQRLAQLVWESFSDLLDGGVAGTADAGATTGTTLLGRTVVTEELLILVLWLHTQACQQAFAGRAGPNGVKATLDALHTSVFDDLETQGVPRGQLPLFEQRVSVRYSEYYAAASHGNGTVGETAARHVCGTEAPPPALCAAVAEAATVIAGPLRDFLEDLELDEGTVSGRGNT